MRECLYWIEDSWEAGICGNRLSSAYECPVSAGCKCRHYKEATCTPQSRSLPVSSSARTWACSSPVC